MMRRFSIKSFAGTARTLVAVGTLKDASMLVTTRAAGPRRTSVFSFASVAGAGPAAGAGVVGAGCGTDGVATGAGALGLFVVSFLGITWVLGVVFFVISALKYSRAKNARYITPEGIDKVKTAKILLILNTILMVVSTALLILLILLLLFF